VVWIKLWKTLKSLFKIKAEIFLEVEELPKLSHLSRAKISVRPIMRKGCLLSIN
jgi:hypothetical protein